MGKINIPVIAYYQFSEVKLHKKYTDLFQLTFARGDHLGRSDLVKPNNDKVLKFETMTQTNCTFQKYTSTNEFKPKRLVVVLRRFVDPSTSRIFAKLEIDLTEFYQKGDVVKTFQMSSKHENKPILTFKCLIEENTPMPKAWGNSKDKPEENYEQSTNDNSELNMILALTDENDDTPETPRDKKRTTSTTEIERQNSDRKMSVHSEHNESDSNDKNAESEQEKETENEEESQTSEESKESESEDEDKNEIGQEVDSEREKEEKTEESNIPLLAKSQTPAKKEPIAPILQQRAKTSARILNMGAFQKMGHFSSISKALQKPVLSIIKVFEYLLTNELPPLAQFSYLDPDRKEFPYPPCVYPIYQTISVYNLFTGYKCEQEMYEKAIELFFRLYPTAPLTPEDEIERALAEQKRAQQTQNAPVLETHSSSSFQMQLTDENAIYRSMEDTFDQFNDDFQPHFDENEMNYKKVEVKDHCGLEQRFMTTLLIILLTTHHIASQGYKNERVKPFLEKMGVLLNEYASKMYSDKLPEFEDLINEFVTARFQQDELKEQFIKKYQSVVDGFKFLPSVNRFLTNRFTRTLDAEIFHKILSNPARFTFSKGAIWNTFLATLANEHQLVFKNTTECVSCILMAVNIATQSQSKDVDLIESLCPDLDHKTIFYILKNYRPDNIQQMTINYMLLAKKLQIDPNDNTFTPMQNTSNEDILSAGDSIKLYNWNQCKLDQSLLSKFPFLLVQKQ